MKILFLSQRFVLPMDTGGKIRTGNLLRELSRRAEITLVSNVERPKDEPFLGDVSSLCSRFVEVPWREARRHEAAFPMKVAVRSLSRYPVSVRNDFSRTLRDAVENACREERFDLAICDFVQSALMFERVSGLPTLLFQHNVESEILRRHVSQSANPLARLFWNLQWKKMLRFESRACREFDHVIAVSERDARQFRELYGVRDVSVIPTGVDTERFAPRSNGPPRGKDLVFCGSMDWLPNEDAMRYFLDEVLPVIQGEHPDATLTIVGRNPSPPLRRRVEGRGDVTLTGWVEDTRPYIERGAIFIVPIRIAGGTRLKIYEGMAMARAVVSTPVGAEGLDVTDGDNIVLAPDAAAFARAVSDLLAEPERRDALGARARRHVCEHFAWPRVAEVFVDICEQVVQRSPGAGAAQSRSPRGATRS